MPLFRKREPRVPHPDPLIEAGLQRIIVFRRMCAEKERQARHSRRLVRRLDRKLSRKRGYDLGAGQRVRLADTLRAEVRELEREMSELQDAIGEQVNALEPDDLLWL